MKRYLDLAPISARVHRKQCRMSVFCIVLSVFLATAIFGMADMYVRSQIVQTQAESGNWHVGIRGISDEDASVVAARPDVDALASYNILNYDGGQGYALDGTEAVICGTDETLVTDIFPGMVAEGRFPRSDSEAVLTENARDMLDLSVGDEIVIATPGGAERRFTVSGFAKNASNLMSGDSYGVIVTAECFRSLSPNAGEGAGSLSDATVYFVQFTDARDVQSKVADLKRRLGLNDEQVFENTKLLGLLGQSSNSFMTQIYAGAGVLGALVLLSSVMMIASGLNINVSQRTEFFGLMRCIGATPKQVMRLVRKEALGWCRFAIPVGIAAGVVLTWALCLVLRALSPEYFGSMPTLAVSLPSILAGAVVGLLTVLLAARSPAKRASKVSPLSAVSGSANDLQPVRKAANTKWLKVETSLGIHHAKSSRKNYVLTIASFGLCIVLFLSFSVTIDFMHHALTPLYPWTPDISIVSTDNTRSVDSGYVDELENNPAVETVYGRMFAYDVPAMVNGEPLTVDLISYERSQFQWAADYLQSGTLDAARNELGTGLAVFDSQGTVRDGDSVVLEVGGEHAEIEIAGTLSASPFNSSNGSAIIVCSEDHGGRRLHGHRHAARGRCHGRRCERHPPRIRDGTQLRRQEDGQQQRAGRVLQRVPALLRIPHPDCPDHRLQRGKQHRPERGSQDEAVRSLPRDRIERPPALQNDCRGGGHLCNLRMHHRNVAGARLSQASFRPAHRLSLGCCVDDTVCGTRHHPPNRRALRRGRRSRPDKEDA